MPAILWGMVIQPNTNMQTIPHGGIITGYLGNMTVEGSYEQPIAYKLIVVTMVYCGCKMNWAAAPLGCLMKLFFNTKVNLS